MPIQLSISNFVNVSVIQPGAGLLPYAVNNLAIFSHETPIGSLSAGYGVYLNAAGVATDWGSTSEAYAQAVAIFSQSPNILTGNGVLIIVPMTGGPSTFETLTVAMTRADTTLGIFYGGALWGGWTPADAEVEAAAAYAQSARHILYVPSAVSGAIVPSTGLFALLVAASESQARCLYYTGTDANARLFAASYASRLQSVDYSGSNTTLNMHAKTLVGVTPDSGITQTILTYCTAHGIDVYPSFGGGGQSLGKVFTSGGNGGYSDDIQNTNWLVYALQVAGFNVLAQTGTKVPQTEQGMASLTGAYTKVMQLGVYNGFLAPGAWNSPDTFGDPATLIRNILQSGFYVYSAPVNQQAQSDRVARKAPLIQIAGKSAGGVNSSNVVVEINA